MQVEVRKEESIAVSDSEDGRSTDMAEDEEGWVDTNAEDDLMEESVVCLFCTQSFHSVKEAFEHCGKEHGFEFWKVVKELGIANDFYGKIKLVNYIRSEVALSRIPEFGSKAFLEDERFLKPVLEDDALLFGLEDEVSGAIESAESKVLELEAKLEHLSRQFAEYQHAVRKTFESQLEEKLNMMEEKAGKKEEGRDNDDHYFHSYAGNDIHEIMLKDTVRTDAYRDFIYNNKHLFKDKVVLDVGCGTGVLSMFCAKAGAKKVIAVDNSAIIDKARANVFENSLGDVITCLRGKIEEVVLPVKQVDVIVSEWMGYCLLYEAMLDSVLFARNKYLAPNGLMVPAECKILVAAMHDSEYMNETVHFWNHVYGFSMTAMKEKIREEVIITHMQPTSLASEPVAFCHLPLHTIRVEDLSFTKPFQLIINNNIESLDGFVLYFDTFFTTSSDQVVVDTARAEAWKDNEGGNALTTGPFGKETHWRQGVLLVEKHKLLKSGEVVKGEITYRKGSKNSREYDIEIEWETSGEKDKQLWYMR